MEALIADSSLTRSVAPRTGPTTSFTLGCKHGDAFALIDDPDDADLVFEVRLLAPNGPADPNKQKGASDPLPTFQLSIIDRKSHYTLWTVNETVQLAYLQKTHDRNFDDALAAMLVDVKRLSAPTQSSAKVAGTGTTQ